MPTGLHVRHALFLSDLMKLEFEQRISEKYSNIKFNEDHSVGAKLFHADRLTDRHGEANSRFSQFSKSAKNVKASHRDLIYGQFICFAV
jgi:hypothetical protein